MTKKTIWAIAGVMVLALGLVKVTAAQHNGALLTSEEAERLAALPLKCLEQEYPNKLSQTLGSAAELAGPRELHPAFYGCFDWHSAVHGHWMLVRLLKLFPGMPSAPLIREKLVASITPEKIAIEADYFRRPLEKSWERTYGWAWLLKLSEELHTWDDPLGRQLEKNLEPLTRIITSLYFNFLPRLVYPVRVGEHPNTAFGLSFALDYARTCGHDSLESLILQRSRDFYATDSGCPLTWEPGGTDFFSPCFEEASLMLRVLPREEFRKWLSAFLPALSSPGFRLEAARVSDRSDGKLVHLDGFNFSRARVLLEIASLLPEYGHLKNTALEHIRYSLPVITDGSYEGEHWLATFALLALMKV